MKAITAVALTLTLIFAVLSGYVWIAEAESAFGVDGVKTGLTLTINYKDGEPETFSNNGFSLAPYTLKSTSGRDIESIDVYVKSSLQTNGVVKSWHVSGTEQTELYRGGETVPKTSASYDFDESGTSWANGETKELLHFNLHWSQIEAVVVDYGAGSWVLQFLCEAEIEVTFEGGSNDIADTVAPAITLGFSYEASSSGGYSITGFDMQIENGVSTLSLTGDFAVKYNLPSWTFHMLFPLLTAVFGAIALLTWKEGA
jgi:hypothetical protein